MLELLPLLVGISSQLDSANIQRLSSILKSIYCISSGGVTMQNISRWIGTKGGSYSSIQRFYNSSIDWMGINVALFYQFYYLPGRVYLLCADETVEDKVGKRAYGIGWFYSSIFGVPIRGICVLGLSVIDRVCSKSWLLGHKQLHQDPKRKEKLAKKRKQKVVKSSNTVPRKRGRKKGTKNKPYELGNHFKVLSNLIVDFKSHLSKIGCPMSICYFVGDGYYGNRSGCKVCLDNELHLISTLRKNAGLYFNYAGIQKSRGRKKKYGQKVDYTNLSSDYLVYENSTEELATYIYQIKAWNKRIPYCLLNVVILVIHDKVADTWARQLYFSTELTLGYQDLMEYYHLRAQIELNFRDAKQYFGLSDFKNTTKRTVTNAIALSFFMVNFSKVLLEKYNHLTGEENLSIQDLKAYFRGVKYVEEGIKYLQNRQDFIFNAPDYLEIAKVGAVNR